MATTKPKECVGCPLYDAPGPVYPQQALLKRTVDEDGDDSDQLRPIAVIVGEAPGEAEVREGVPFVGASGRKLRAMLGKAGIKSSACYITNVVKCRPPGNATPPASVVDKCAKAFLEKELSQLGDVPTLAVGTIASQYLLGDKITRTFGYRHKNPRGSSYIVAVYHPAMLLRDSRQEPAVQEVLHRFLLDSEMVDPMKYTEINPKPYDLQEFVYSARSQKYIVFDLETVSLLNRKIVCCGISIPTGRTVVASWDDRVAGILKPLFEDPTVIKIAYNIRFDAGALMDNGINLAGDWYDLMRLVQLDDKPVAKMSLEGVAPLYITVQPWKHKSNVEGLLVYNAKDTYYELRIWQSVYNHLYGTAAYSLFLRTVDLEKVVLSMERRGIMLDIPKMVQLREQANKQYNEVLRNWNVLTDGANPRSQQQVLEVLKRYGVKPWLTNEGKPTTEERYLKLMAARGGSGTEVIETLLELRRLGKLISTYLSYEPDIDCVLHPNINTAGTVSGRFSTSNPNLANIPKAKDSLGIRSLFIARPGYKFISSDWSQAEARITAILANETSMLEAWDTGRDVHKVTASALFNTTEDKVTKNQRELAKRILYGLSYGSGPRKIAELTEITFKEASTFLGRFKRAFPAYFEMLDIWTRDAIEVGYLVNPFGRVHSFYGDRVHTQARNFIPQSTVADMMNIVLCNMWKTFNKEKLDAHILLQVYDQVVVEAQESIVDTVKDIVHSCMNVKWKEIGGRVIPADVTVGDNWGEL